MVARTRCSAVSRYATATVFLTLVASVLLWVEPASAEVIHRPLHAIARITSAPVDAAFPIEYFGFAADVVGGGAPPAETGSAPFGEVRFRSGRMWGAWQSIGEDGAQGEGTFTAALIAVNRADAYEVRGVPASFAHTRAAVLNLDDGAVESVHRTFGSPAGAAATCASRADWNADESITAWSKGTDTPAFSPDQVLTVHHTAGSNDPSQNFAATVRAIEQYHVITNGWSDIGYQYLIDPNGVVYEGRYAGHTSTSCAQGGGDGSDFAHRLSDDAVVTGAHVGGYNTGNLGIAMLGCFDSQSSTCSPGAYGANDTTPTAAATGSLRQLLSRLSTRHGLDPTGTVTYANGTNTKTGAPTISAHRDWEATACPGGNVYAQLPTIRTQVSSDLRPTGIQSAVTASTAHLSWAAGAAWSTAPRATRYLVTRQGGPTAITSATTFDDAGLAAGTAYHYDLAAVSSSGAPSSPTVTVTVTTTASAPPPGTSDFTLQVDPATLTAAGGSTTTVTVSTTAVGSPGNVSLTASMQPASAFVTATLGAATVAAGGSTTLQVATTAAAPPGTYTIKVTGQAGGLTRSATYAEAVTNAPPTARITTAFCSHAKCSFAGSGSDPEGGRVTLRWTFPGNSGVGRRCGFGQHDLHDGGFNDGLTSGDGPRWKRDHRDHLRDMRVDRTVEIEDAQLRGLVATMPRTAKPLPPGDPGPHTLVIDVGGTGLKATVLDANGRPLHDRVRSPTTYPCPPSKLEADLVALVAALPPYQRISVGFPGVVRDGRVVTAPHFVTAHGPGSRVQPDLVEAWTGFDLSTALTTALGAPTRVANDADVQGAGVVSGDGIALVLTFGTGMGSAVFRDRTLALHLELAHHVAFGDKTYNDYIGDAARRDLGAKRWNRRVRKVLVALDALVYPDAIFVGGGNAARVDLDRLRRDEPSVAAKVRLVGNDGGLLGGIRLWDGAVIE